MIRVDEKLKLKLKLKLNNKKKKIRNRIKKNVVNLVSAFSLVEVSISVLIISIIAASLTPVISKRVTGSVMANKISTNCDSIDSFCAMCYPSMGKCISCTKTCESNQYRKEETCSCINCSSLYGSYCAKCNSKECVQCKEGYFLNDDKMGCSKCPIGYYCYQENGVSKKLKCPKGTYGDVKGLSECKKCPRSDENTIGGYTTTTGNTSCIWCSDGKRTEVEGQTSACTTCPRGYYCPSGYYIPCPKGYANNLTGQTECTKCIKATNSTIGTYASSTASVSCLTCDNGQYAKTAGASGCSDCAKGYYCVNGYYTPCPKGTSTKDKTKATVCTNCLASASNITGTVATSTASVTCLACGDGKYSNKAGRTSSCLNCPEKYYCPSGMLIPCPSGSYCPSGSTSATSCSAGYYSTGSVISCSECPKGQYSSSAGSTSCSKCEKGTYASSTALTKCSNCPKGTYNNGEGLSSCTDCSAGYYAKDTGSTECTKCSAGYYSKAKASICTQCSAGYYSKEGASECAKCTTGYYSKAGASECKACTSFHEKCTACSSTGCTTCASGYKVDGTGCKVSFDCEAEGGVKSGNICYKKIMLEKGYIINSNTTSTLCGSTWREPTREEACDILGSTSWLTIPSEQPYSVSDTKEDDGTAYRKYVYAVMPCKGTYKASTSKCNFGGDSFYSPGPGCKWDDYGMMYGFCYKDDDNYINCKNNQYTSVAAGYSNNRVYIGCIHELEE